MLATQEFRLSIFVVKMVNKLQKKCGLRLDYTTTMNELMSEQ